MKTGNKIYKGLLSLRYGYSIRIEENTRSKEQRARTSFLHRIAAVILCLMTMGVGQMWANGGIGYKGVKFTKNGSATGWYNIHNVSWGYSNASYECRSGQSGVTDFNNANLGTVTTLQLKAFVVIGWTDNADYVAGQLKYRLYKQSASAPSYSTYNVGNYGSTSNSAKAANVLASSGNDRVVGSASLTTNIVTASTAPGNYYLQLQGLGRMQWSNGSSHGDFNTNNGPEVKATLVVPGFTTTSTSQTFDNTIVGSNSSKTISFTQHFGTALTTSNCALSGTNSSEFEVTSISETGVTVKFKPSTAGSKSATLTITDAHSKTCTITLTGTGTSPSVPTITFGTTSGTINWGDKINITVTTANIANGSTITFKVGGSSIGTANVSSNSATLSNYQPTAFAASTTITAEYSGTTSSNNYTLNMNTPAVSLSASPTSAGTGENITFTATKSNVSSNATVTYKFEDITSGTTTIQAASATTTCTTSWAANGSKTVKVTMTVTFSGSNKTATATKAVTISPKTTIYFDNTATGWSNVYLYLYSKNYWNASNGSGGKTANGRYGSLFTMTKVGGTGNIYSYTYTGDVPAYVCFINSTGMDDYEYFWNGTAGTVRAAYMAFSAATPLYIPTTTYTALNDGGKVYYYNGGEWSVYPPAAYTLTVVSESTTKGTITTPAGGSYTDVAKNASKSIVASPKAGYAFTNWTASPAANATIASSTSASTTVTVKGDVTVTAHFEPSYTLTVNVSPAGAGTITSPSGGTAAVATGSTTDLRATNNGGYSFVNWTKVSGTGTISNATSMNSNASITGVSSATTVQANFTQDNYTVTMAAVGGRITVPATSPLTNKHYNDNITVTAISDGGLAFVGWEASPAGNATFANSGALSTTATIKGNVTITARFREPITIYVSNEQCWDALKIHAWDAVGGSVSSTFPGNAMTQDANGWWTYTFDNAVTQVSFLFANSDGSRQTNDISSVTATTYYKTDPTDNNRNYTTTTSAYEPQRCIPDVYTVVGDAAMLGSSWDTNDGSNEMTWNATNNRYELRKVNVPLTTGLKEYKIVKNHCYSGAGCGEWPLANANHNFTTAKSYDLLFWVKPSSDFAHPGLDDSYGLIVSDVATYTINHPWGGGDWSRQTMVYSGSGNTYTASGIFGGDGANINDTWFAPASISGYNTVATGDNVIFTYDATANTLSVRCPTCITTTKYWICVPAQNGNTIPENPQLMTYNPETGLYYTSYSTLAYKWPGNGAKVNSNNNCSDNWIDRNNIVNWDKMTNGQAIEYIYDPDINELTVIDANTPKLSLTSSQVVDAEAPQSVITLTTTSTKTLHNATYSYSKISGPDGTLAESETNTTTFTTSNEGTYNFKVSVTADEGTFTATCTVKVKFRIVVYVNVTAPAWTGTINMNYSGANHAMTNVGGDWYWLEVVGVPDLTFSVREGTGTGLKQTIDIGPVEDDICIVVKTDLQGGKRTYTTTNDCELYTRFASTYRQFKGSVDTEENITVYSNYIKLAGEEVSFYVGSTPNVKYQTFNSATNSWNAGTTVSIGVSGGDVYAGEFNPDAANKLKNFAVYDGDFYIRTDGAAGGWSNYKNENQVFFEFSRNDYFENEWYNHYWCKWMDGNPNVKAVVANDINPAISDTLSDFVLTQGTNMRFEYDNQTNYIGRQFLKGSGGDFLRIFASDDDAQNFIFKTDASDTRIKKANAVTLTDKSDWVYQIDILAKPTGSDVNVYVLGRYPVTRAGIGANSDQDNYLGGYEADGVTPTPIKIMGSTTTPDTYNMRLIYDYKTNRLIAAWYPAGSTIGGTTTTVDANFLITRENDNDAVTFDMANSGAKVVSINQMYSALVITRSEYNTRKAAGNYYYWVSLPYDVLVRDIFGINGYGKKWVVQRYRGDKRAQYGFTYDIETFWANMKQNATAKMEANRGYVIRIRLTDADFKEINGVSQVTLYFPSCNTSDITLQNAASALQSSVPPHLCEVIEPASGNSRKNWDSHWNVIGQPGLKTMQITNPTQLTSNPDEYVEANYPKFYYKWSWSAGQGVYTPTAVSGVDNSFRTFYAYMVQYGGGTITWQPNIETIDPSLAPRRIISADNKDIVIGLNLSGQRDIEHIEGEDLHSVYETVTDNSKTIVTLSKSGSESFVLNRDMAKISNGRVNIYTVFDETYTSGKVLPFETTEVKLAVDVAQDNEYTFSLDNPVGNRLITLIDHEEGLHTLLNYDDYPVELTRGTYPNRFSLKITKRKDVATDILSENQTDDNLMVISDGNALYVEGITEPSELILYDIMGRMLFRGVVRAGEAIEAPQTGMYIVKVNDQVKRVILQQ